MKRFLLYIIMLGVCTSISAQTPLEHFLHSPAIKSANVGVVVRSLNTGKSLASYQSTSIISPASVLKLFSTATALEVWGDDHRFTTELRYSGTIRNGVLNGNLYIVGAGDPTLGSKDWGGDAFLREWVQAIQQAGIKKIHGGVLADVSYYDEVALNPNWIKEDIGNYYAPGVFALAYLDNTLTFQLQSGEVGSAATVLQTIPEQPELQIENEIRCSTIDYDGAYVYGLPYQNVRHLTGYIPSNRGVFNLKGDLPNPALLLATHLTQRLQISNVSVRDEARVLTQADSVPTTLLYTYQSPTLDKIVEQTNQHSINLNAEMIFRNLAAQRAVPCSIANAADFVKQFWHDRGVDLSSACLLDGCGLSPKNGVSANQLVHLLTYMAKSKHQKAFYQSLPISGQSGTLKSFLAQTELEGHVYAKSGTIKATRNYAGYIAMPGGDQLVFAILVSGSSASSQQIKNAIEQYLLDVYNANK